MIKILTAYFSLTGNTEKAARYIASKVHSDLFEIVPSILYSEKDLDWTNPNSRINSEMSVATTRPSFDRDDLDIAQYNYIFLGFPIWYYTAPHIINTFLECYDLKDKTIILFATSAGSDLKKVAGDLYRSANGAKLVRGKVVNLISTAELDRWLNSLIHEYKLI